MLLLFALVGGMGCGGPVAHLQSVRAARAALVPVAAVELRPLVDRRADESIGHGANEVTRLEYTAVGDGPVAPWVESYVRSEFVAGGLGGAARGGSLPEATLAVTMVQFELTERTWIRGVAVFDVALTLADGTRATDRLTIVTTGLATDDGDAEWTQAAAKLASWSAHQIAAWTRARVLSG